MPPKKQRARGPRLSAVREDTPSPDLVNNEEEMEQEHIEEDDQEDMNQIETDDDSIQDISEDLIQEDFQNTQEENVKKKKTPKELNAAVKLLRIRDDMTREEKSLVVLAKSIKKGMLDAMRRAFQSRENVSQDLVAASQKMIAVFKKANNNRHRAWDLMKMFYSELENRLIFMVDETSVPEHRACVFKLCALVGTELIILNYGDEFFQFILNFVCEASRHSSAAVRINVSCFVNYIFETGKNQFKEMRPDKFCGYSIDDSCRLFLILRKALSDKEYTARVPAIKGMGLLQSLPIPSGWTADARSTSPREFLIRACRDSSWECRLVAVQSLKAGETDIRLLSDITYFDRAAVVRIAALDQISKLKPNKFVRDKVTLLDICFRDHEAAIRDAAKGVLRAWVHRLSDRWSEAQKNAKEVVALENGTADEIDPVETKMKGYFLAGQALTLLWLSDTPETVESHSNVRRMLTHTLDVIRQMYVCHGEPINAFADVIIGDLREKMLESAVPVVTKSTIGSLLEDSDMGNTHDISTNRAMIFYWRSVIEFMADRKRSDADKITALSRFISPLKTMVEHLNRLIVRIKDEEELGNTDGIENYEDNLYIIQMSVTENLVSIMKHAQAEQSGRDAYKQLLISMLMNPFYQKKVLDVIVSELGQFYKDCPDDLFSMVCARTSELRQKYKGEEFPVLEGSVHVGEKKFRKDWLEERRSGISEREQGLRFIDMYELKVLNCLLKTNLLTSWGTEYENRYGEMLRNHKTSTVDDSRVLATECIGMIGVYDFDQVKDDLQTMVDGFKTEAEPVQEAILHAVTDVSIEHGDRTNCLFENDPKHGNHISIFLSDILLMSPPYVPVTSLVIRAVESISRLMLNTRIDSTDGSWQRSLVTLMYRATYSITDIGAARVRSLILIMLKFFCSMRKNNQSLLLHTYHRFFDLWTNTTDTALFSPERQDMGPKLKRCAAAYVALTRHSLLPAAEQKKTRPAHIDLVDEILHELTGSSQSATVDYYVCALNYIDFQSFSRTALTKIHGDLDDYIEVHLEDEDRTRFNELRRASRKIAKILGLNENEEEIEEVPSSYSRNEARTNAHKSKKSSSNATITEFGATDIAADIGQASDDDLEVDDNEPSTSSRQPVKRTRGPRSTPASATKRKPDEHVVDIMKSPQGKPRKPPSRPTSSSRPSATPLRTGPTRSARRLNADK